jgi:hypothetical protein
MHRSTRQQLHSKGISYVVTPQIVTDSSSPSIMTWPPTDFSVTLTCSVADLSGKLIAQPVVHGTGHAEFDEFKHNLGLAAQRQLSMPSVSYLQRCLISRHFGGAKNHTMHGPIQ